MKRLGNVDLDGKYKNKNHETIAQRRGEDTEEETRIKFMLHMKQQKSGRRRNFHDRWTWISAGVTSRAASST